MQSILSVSSLNQLARQVLEGALGTVEVMGEVSTLRKPGSGHMYFVLKDEAAQVRCALFRQSAMRAKHRPEEGDQVIVTAEVTLYEARGDYQLIVRDIQPAGGGRLAQLFEALKRKLDAEGLFSPERKRAIPLLPRRIAVISSPTGAAIQDVLSVITRRMPLAEVTLFPVAVQGGEAAGQLREAVASIRAEDGFDAVLIVRGGGSIEDLWPFNDEALARAIAACPVPVVSGVGHEIDFTICDFVADHRAATPTAAAEMVTGMTEQQLRERLQRVDLRLQQTMRLRLERQMQRADRLQFAVLHHGPRRQLGLAAQRVALIQARLSRLMRQRVQDATTGLLSCERRLAQVSPQQWLRRGYQSLGRLQQRLGAVQVRAGLERQQARLAQRQGLIVYAMAARIQRSQTRLELLQQTLRTINPDRVLERGYALVTAEDRLVGRAAGLQRDGEAITIRFYDGSVPARVERPGAGAQPEGKESAD